MFPLSKPKKTLQQRAGEAVKALTDITESLSLLNQEIQQEANSKLELAEKLRLEAEELDKVKTNNSRIIRNVEKIFTSDGEQ